MRRVLFSSVLSVYPPTRMCYATKQRTHKNPRMSNVRLPDADTPGPESSGVAVAVNNPVRVGLMVGLELEPKLEMVLVAPGHSLDAAYHTPLMMAPSPFNMLCTTSAWHEFCRSRRKHVGFGEGGKFNDEEAAAEPEVL